MVIYNYREGERTPEERRKVMNTVVVLTPSEYEDLKASEETLAKVLEELGKLQNEPEKLKEYIESILY